MPKLHHTAIASPEDIVEQRMRVDQVLIEMRNQFSHAFGLLENLGAQTGQAAFETRNLLQHLDGRLTGLSQRPEGAGLGVTVGPAEAEEDDVGPGDDIFHVDLQLPITARVSIEAFCHQIATYASERLTPHERYLLAERLAYAADPTLKFSEFGRLFLEDQDFIALYRETMDRGNWHSLDRKYLVREMLGQIAHIPGDFVECGVYKGATAKIMAMAAGGTRRVHLFDSWEGLSAPGPHDGTFWEATRFDLDMNVARSTLAGHDNCRFYQGWIPQRFADVADIAVAFLHIDVDLYDPTYASVAFFYPRLQPGALMICDDYGVTTCPGARKAIDDFLADKPERAALLPTGQALVLKQ